MQASLSLLQYEYNSKINIIILFFSTFNALHRFCWIFFRLSTKRKKKEEKLNLCPVTGVLQKTKHVTYCTQPHLIIALNSNCLLNLQDLRFYSINPFQDLRSANKANKPILNKIFSPLQQKNFSPRTQESQYIFAYIS